MATEAGTIATFTTIGGADLTFVHEGGVYGYGQMACGGCHTSQRSTVGEANEHASTCRAR